MAFDARLQRSTLVGGVTGVIGSPLSVHADVLTYGMPVPGTFTAQGASCPGSGGTPMLSPPPGGSTGPVLGGTAWLAATPVQGQTFFVFGLSDALDGSLSLPHDLTALGMPGCALLVRRDAITSALPNGGAAVVAIAVPNDPFLAGQQFFVQAFPVDGTANPVGLVTTNAIRASIGRL